MNSTGSAPTSRLEERYRAVLRLLPAGYRELWEADMVAAFLESRLEGNTPDVAETDPAEPDVAETDSQESDDWDSDEFLSDYGRPSLGEIGSVVALAVRLRVAGADGSPRSHALGRAVGLAALIVTLVNAVGATASILISLWLTSRHHAVDPALNTNDGLWHTAWNLAGYAWLPAYFALLFGYRRAAQAVALLAIAPFAVTVAIAEAIGDDPVRLLPWALVLLDILAVAAMPTLDQNHSGVRRRAWLLALPIGILAVPLPLVAVQVSVEPARVVELARILDMSGLFCLLVTVAALGYLAGCLFGRRAPALPWSAALALLAGAALAMRLATLPDDLAQFQPTTIVTMALVEAAATLIAGAPLAVSALRSLRELPALHRGAAT